MEATQPDEVTRKTIQDDLIQTMKETEYYPPLYLIWSTFTSKLQDPYDHHVFATYLKTFKNVPNHTVKTILTQLLIQVKYAIPYTKEKEDDVPMYALETFNLFHPVELDVSFKTLISYLEANHQLELLHDLPRSTIYTKLADELNVNNCSIYNALSVYKTEFEKFKESKQFKPHLTFAELQTYLVKHTTESLYASVLNTKQENHIYQLLLKHSATRLKPSPPMTEFKGLRFTEEQVHCIQSCITHPISLISGSAGTGKTTLSMAIASILIQRGEKVLFLTITAKARDVLRSKLVVGATAITVSKYLCGRFKQQDNIIVDEASMIGNAQLVTFLRCFTKRLILMGDAKQVLPVKQLGTPFISLVDNPHIHHCSLTTVKRQESDNPISVFIQNVVSRIPTTLPDYNGETKGVFYKVTNDFPMFYEERYKQYANQMCCIKPAHYAACSDAIQERLFKRDKPLGVKPKSYDRSFQSVYTGSYVMRCSNESVEVAKDKLGKPIHVDISNGSFGYVTGGDDYGNIQVRYDSVVYNHVPFVETVSISKLFKEFQLGFCQSTHKFQGSEYNQVLFNMNGNGNLFCMGGKNLFYTTITRAKELLILCGKQEDRALIQAMIMKSFAKPVHDIQNAKASADVPVMCLKQPILEDAV